MVDTNRRILLVQRPTELVEPGCFELSEAPVPEPGDGEAVVRIEYLSLDPAQRGWMGGDTYIPAIELGDVVRSAAVGTVVASRRPDLPEGTRAMGLLGWQEYALVDAATLAQPVPDGIGPADAVSLFGSTGLTAYFGVFDVGRLQEGETLLVSAAAGGVGSIAGQLGRIVGARVVGIAGSDEKCRWVVDELGLDACINRRTHDVGTRLDELCPDGIDVYFDNVGGPILEAVLARLALHARVAMCGAISQYNDTEPPPGPRNLANLITQRARIEGFLLFDHLDRFGEAAASLGAWLAEGRLVNRVDVVDGLEQAPVAYNRLFTGDNVGKLLVRVADDAPV